MMTIMVMIALLGKVLILFEESLKCTLRSSSNKQNISSKNIREIRAIRVRKKF